VLVGWSRRPPGGKTMGIKTCNCGSGHERYALTDAAGIFCAYVCDDCEDKVRARYNPAIFGGNSAYASSGDEAALEIDCSDDFDGY
jgi:hypothetical protein